MTQHQRSGARLDQAPAACPAQERTQVPKPEEGLVHNRKSTPERKRLQRLALVASFAFSSSSCPSVCICVNQHTPMPKSTHSLPTSSTDACVHRHKTNGSRPSPIKTSLAQAIPTFRDQFFRFLLALLSCIYSKSVVSDSKFVSDHAFPRPADLILRRLVNSAFAVCLVPKYKADVERRCRLAPHTRPTPENSSSSCSSSSSAPTWPEQRWPAPSSSRPPGLYFV